MQEGKMPDYHVIKIGCLVVILLVLLIAAVIILVRREKSKKKIRRMCNAEKIQCLNEIAEPFGFCYVPCEDVFTSRENAWQKEQGYEALYDKAAVGAGMVFDALPVYFDYGGETWLIEFWKGQYGINTGGEVGVYHAGKIIPEQFYKIAHFEAVEDQDMPFIQCRLDRKRKKVYFLQKRHWWLTGFRMGMFSKTSDLTLVTTMRFKDECMAEAFFGGLKRAKEKIPGNKYRICRNEVYVRMDFCVKHKFSSAVLRSIMQAWNCCCCFFYRVVTHPFVITPDRLLFLYYQLPWCLKHAFRMRGRKYGK